MSDISIGSTSTEQGNPGQSVLQQGSELKQKGTLQLQDQIDERTTQAGEQVRSFADVLRRTGTELESESGSAGMSRAVSGMADRLESVGDYLQRAKGDELLRDAERFTRNRPWVVAGVAAAVGFAASRLLKASSENRYSQSNGNSMRGPSWQPAGYETGRSESDWVEPATVVSGSTSR